MRRRSKLAAPQTGRAQPLQAWRGNFSWERFMPLSRQSAFVGAVLVSVFAGWLAALPARAQNRDQDEHRRIPKRIVADYTSGAKFLDPPYAVAQIPFHKLTHIIHAGVPWNSDGSLYIENGFVEPDLVRKAHAHGVKVMLLTGGDFAAIEASPQVSLPFLPTSGPSSPRTTTTASTSTGSFRRMPPTAPSS
jgi:hypothetical protein